MSITTKAPYTTDSEVGSTSPINQPIAPLPYIRYRKLIISPQAANPGALFSISDNLQSTLTFTTTLFACHFTCSAFLFIPQPCAFPIFTSNIYTNTPCIITTHPHIYNHPSLCFLAAYIWRTIIYTRLYLFSPGTWSLWTLVPVLSIPIYHHPPYSSKISPPS